jgi:hypothetical protein
LGQRQILIKQSSIFDCPSTEWVCALSNPRTITALDLQPIIEHLQLLDEEKESGLAVDEEAGEKAASLLQLASILHDTYWRPPQESRSLKVHACTIKEASTFYYTVCFRN